MNWTCNQAIKILKLTTGGSQRTCQRQDKMESYFEHAHMKHKQIILLIRKHSFSDSKIPKMKYAPKICKKTFLVFPSNKNRYTRLLHVNQVVSLKHMASVKYIDKIQHYYWHTHIIFYKEHVFSTQYETDFFESKCFSGISPLYR